MAVFIYGSGAGNFGGLFPSEYPNMKSTALGDTFPGWDADIIPICISVYAGTSVNISIPPGVTNRGTISSSRTLNGNKTVASLSSSSLKGTGANQGGTAYLTGDWVGAYAYSIFLPYFYNFDFELMKTKKSEIMAAARSVSSTAGATVWLER